MITVHCYADPVSPYTWLGLRDLARLEYAGARVVLVPVLFAGLLNAHGNIGPAEMPAKRDSLFRDVMRRPPATVSRSPVRPATRSIRYWRCACARRWATMRSAVRS